MFTSIFPFRYYAALPDSTLTTKIREESWKLDKIFPSLESTKSKLNKLRINVKPDLSGILKLQHTIALLAAEIRAGIKHLKIINFYDSAILYLYFKLLNHVYALCSKEQAGLSEEKQKVLLKKIKTHEKLINGFDDTKKELIKAYENLVKELDKRRWNAEKQAQHEYRLLKFTLRGMKNLNRKIKVVAIKVKTNVVPQKNILIKRIQQGHVKPEDVVSLAKLVSAGVDNASKDIYYSSKLISKFESEFKSLKEIIENLKKTINKNTKISNETAKKLMKPWDDTVKYLEGEINKDLMQIFRNIFVEYKYIGTRSLEKTA